MKQEMIEHFNYDLIMAYKCVELLKFTTDQFWRNVLHAACPVYISNLLKYLGTDIENFNERTENQVRSLTEKRTPVQSEKLNTPDYEKALAHVLDVMKIKNIKSTL